MYRLFSTNGKFDLQSPEKHPIATNEKMEEICLKKFGITYTSPIIIKAKKIIREVMAEWLN